MRMAAIAEATYVQPELDGDTLPEAKMVRMLVFFAAWRSCSRCGDVVLYVGGSGRSDAQFVCGRCMEYAHRQLGSVRGRSRGFGGNN